MFLIFLMKIIWFNNLWFWDNGCLVSKVMERVVVFLGMGMAHSLTIHAQRTSSTTTSFSNVRASSSTCRYHNKEVYVDSWNFLEIEHDEVGLLSFPWLELFELLILFLIWSISGLMIARRIITIYYLFSFLISSKV